MAKRFTQKKLDKYRNVLINRFTVTPESFDIELSKHFQKFGDSESSRQDFIWRIFNELVVIFPKYFLPESRELYSILRDLYSEMGAFLIDTGCNRNHVHKKFFETQLKLLEIDSRDFGYEQDVEVIGGHCCEYCNKLDGLKLPIDEFIKLNPIPGACSNPNGCNCTYAMTARFDKRGRLIQKLS